MLRRFEGETAVPTQNITVGTLAIGPEAHTVPLAGEPTELPPREFDLLHALAMQPNKVVSVDE